MFLLKWVWDGSFWHTGIIIRCRSNQLVAALTVIDKCIVRQNNCLAFIRYPKFQATPPFLPPCMGQSDVRAEDDAAWCWGPLHQTGPLLLADRGVWDAVCHVIWPAARLCIRSAQHSPQEWGKRWFWGRTLKTGDDRLQVERQEAPWPHPQHPHHEGNRSHPGWTVWESDRGEGTTAVIVF